MLSALLEVDIRHHGRRGEDPVIGGGEHLGQLLRQVAETLLKLMPMLWAALGQGVEEVEGVRVACGSVQLRPGPGLDHFP